MRSVGTTTGRELSPFCVPALDGPRSFTLAESCPRRFKLRVWVRLTATSATPCAASSGVPCQRRTGGLPASEWPMEASELVARWNMPQPPTSLAWLNPKSSAHAFGLVLTNMTLTAASCGQTWIPLSLLLRPQRQHLRRFLHSVLEEFVGEDRGQNMSPSARSILE